MSKGLTFETDLLKLYFHGTPIATVADNAASAPFTEHVIALHTADPGDGGAQSTNETAYTGYSRKTVPRNSGGWTVIGNVVNPEADIVFDSCTAAPGLPITHWSCSRGGGIIDYTGPVTPPIAMAVGVSPTLKTLSTIRED